MIQWAGNIHNRLMVGFCYMKYADFYKWIKMKIFHINFNAIENEI